MVQFNLLPDVKKEYIKVRRTKRLIITISTFISVASIILLALLFSFVQFAQKNNINDLTEDIRSGISKIESTEGLDEILTIQNQLNTLPSLAQERPEVSRLFGYLQTVTPVGVYISNVEMSVVDGSIEIAGTASSLSLINQYADTIKFATYTTSEGIEGRPFSNVLTSLSKTDESSAYTIEMSFDPILFDNTQDVTVTVEEAVTTRSVLRQPNLDTDSPLFIEDVTIEQGGQQ